MPIDLSQGENIAAKELAGAITRKTVPTSRQTSR